MKRSAVVAFILSAGLAASIWALSAPVTGKAEPWDDEGLYYLIALILTGAISGAVVPKHLGAHYLGAVLGQVAYNLIFIKPGPLFGLGVAFLAGYGGVFLAAATIVSLFRRSKPNERTGTAV